METTIKNHQYHCGTLVSRVREQCPTFISDDSRKRRHPVRFAVSLEAAAKAIGPYGKPAGMNATMAPTLWASGKTDAVLEYLSNDCRMTLEVAMASLLKKSFRWIAHSGNRRDFDLRSGWLSVREAMLLPQPDTSWMTSPPWPRSKFTAWLHMFDK